MQGFGKRRARRDHIVIKFAATIAVLSVLGGLFFVSARAAWRMYGKFVEASYANEAAAAQLAELRQKHERIQDSVEALSSPRGLEAEVRARFGVARPGEGEIKIVRDTKEDTAPETQSRSLWSRIIGFFGAD